ncbi:Glutathione S-transferase like protein [Argiope bruennichi]|uniref:glutathione transferase n=2 Tax=Argiope bruennichi TaxID=94029 RepID=A0A8T0EUC1_ARGBR|nr:Glutathione S-transferase like protein [Argiope bruennichi]
MSKPLLGYWDRRGVAEPIRYLLHFRNVDFEEKRYGIGTGEWWNEKFNLGLDFPNLPYLIDGDIKLTQSIAILRYLGHKFGLDGKNEQQIIRVFLAEQQSVDFRAKFRAFALTDRSGAGKDEFFINAQPVFKQWEAFLGDRRYLAGDDITYVDFMFYENLDNYRLLHTTILDEYPLLKTFHTRIKNLPEMQAYFYPPRFRRWPYY